MAPAKLNRKQLKKIPQTGNLPSWLLKKLPAAEVFFNSGC